MSVPEPKRQLLHTHLCLWQPLITHLSMHTGQLSHTDPSLSTRQLLHTHMPTQTEQLLHILVLTFVEALVHVCDCEHRGAPAHMLLPRRRLLHTRVPHTAHACPCPPGSSHTRVCTDPQSGCGTHTCPPACRPCPLTPPRAHVAPRDTAPPGAVARSPRQGAVALGSPFRRGACREL